MATGPVAGQRQGRILARGDDQVHLGRQVLEQKGETRVDRVTAGQVKVVQHQDDFVAEERDLVEQARQHGFHGRRLGRLQLRQ